MTDRTPREATTREKTSRVKEWQPPSKLPMPNPRDGWEHKWIRKSTLGQTDATNMAGKQREGFEICNLEEYPELGLGDKGTPEVGGLVLARIPIEVADSRREYHRRQNEAALQAVDANLMKVQNKRMPIFNESETQVTRGKVPSR